MVVDASVVVAALIDGGAAGSWAERILLSGPLAAPHLMPIEATSVLRRAERTGDIGPEVAALAQADLLALPVRLFAYAPMATRVWALRNNLGAYDACYVALAESLDAPLATLDRRLRQASGPRCDFVAAPT